MLGIGRARVKLLIVLTVTVGLVTLLSLLSYTSPRPRHKESSSTAEMKGEETGDSKGEGIEGREGEEEGLNGGYREEGVQGETRGGEEGRVGLSRDSIERGKNTLEGGKQGVKEVNKMEVKDKGVEGGEGEKTPQKDLVKPKALSPKELQKRADSLPQDSPVHSFLREQRRRVAHVAESCRASTSVTDKIVGGDSMKNKILKEVPDIVLDRKDLLTFCPVYKAASTSVYITMLMLAGHWPPSTQGLTVQRQIQMHFKRLNGHEALSRIPNTTYFMVVRHPLERFLSCYRDKYENGRKDLYYTKFGEDMIRQQREAVKDMSNKERLALQEEVRLALNSHRKEYGEGAGEGDFLNLPHNPFANPVGPTFLEFSQYIVNTGYDDQHWRPYHVHCASCILPYEFVLRFESLEEETLLFLDYLNRTGEAALRRENSNWKAVTAEVSCQYYSQLPLALIDSLVQKYEKDLIMYEYDAEEYRRCAKDYRRSGSAGGGDVEA